MAFTQQLGTTLLFPCPSHPCCQRTNCLYAACRKFSLFRGCSIARISSLYLIATSKMFPSNTIWWNNGFLVMHSRTLWVQHLFSTCVGMATHNPHLHQLGELLSSGGPVFSGGTGGSTFIAGNSPFTKSANIAGWRLSNSTARRLTVPSFKPFTNSYI
jgi:hypothetical protein